MKLRYYTIPIFVPELACPFRCVFCNQYKITGKPEVPTAEEAENIIKTHLSTFREGPRNVEVGFFGGNFTGIDIKQQEKYLEVAKRYLDQGSVQGIRVSTRPDYIDDEKMEILKKYDVTTVELGAQSMDEEVLELSVRGHTVADTERSAALVKKYGFSLGLQMMIGLPGDSLKKAFYTARKIISMGADNTRIYPALVIKDTKLEEWYQKGEFEPLTLNEAVRWTKSLVPLFEKAGVKVIRVGLHPSDGLMNESDLIAGPFHPSFREFVETEMWWDKMQPILKMYSRSGKIEILVPDGTINAAIGYEAVNRRKLLEKYKKVTFKTHPSMTGRNFRVVHR